MERQDGEIWRFCCSLFVPAKNRRCSSKLLIRFGVADGRILNHWMRAFSFIQRAASRKAA